MRTSSREIRRVDIESMEARARQSVDGEAYVQIFRSDACRIGIMAAVSETGRATFSIEVLFTSMDQGTGEVLAGLNDLVETVTTLTERGYVIDHQGDGWLVACKGLQPRSINAELDMLASVIQKCEEKGRQIR